MESPCICPSPWLLVLTLAPLYTNGPGTQLETQQVCSTGSSMICNSPKTHNSQVGMGSIPFMHQGITRKLYVLIVLHTKTNNDAGFSTALTATRLGCSTMLRTNWQTFVMAIVLQWPKSWNGHQMVHSTSPSPCHWTLNCLGRWESLHELHKCCSRTKVSTKIRVG